MGNIADVDHRTVDAFDRQVTQVFDGGGRIVQADGVFQAVNFLCAHRCDDVLRGQCGGHILCTQTTGLQFGQVQINLYLPRFTAVGKRNGGPWHSNQGCAHLR